MSPSHRQSSHGNCLAVREVLNRVGDRPVLALADWAQLHRADIETARDRFDRNERRVAKREGVGRYSRVQA